jgi:hypothetical protein
MEQLGVEDHVHVVVDGRAEQRAVPVIISARLPQRPAG